MLDLLIRGGDVVTPHGVENCDIGIAGETIAAVAAPGTLPAESAGRSIDATGRIVMPGGIDPHVHLNRMRRRDTSGQSRTQGNIRRHAGLLPGIVTRRGNPWQSGD